MDKKAKDEKAEWHFYVIIRIILHNDGILKGNIGTWTPLTGIRQDDRIVLNAEEQVFEDSGADSTFIFWFSTKSNHCIWEGCCSADDGFNSVNVA